MLIIFNNNIKHISTNIVIIVILIKTWCKIINKYLNNDIITELKVNNYHN